MRNNNRIIVIFLAFAGLVLCAGSAAQAARPVCILKTGEVATFPSPNTATPCTANKTAYDGTKTLVDFSTGCTGGTYEMDVFFEQGSAVSKLVSFQTSVKFIPTELVTPTCTVDPEDYFSDELVTPECPATNGADKYVYGAQANLFGDKWPSSNPNFRLMKIAFASLGFVEGATSTMTFYTTIPSRVTRVTDADTTVSDATPSADVICSTPPINVKAPTNGAAVQGSVVGTCTPTSGTRNVNITFTNPTQCLEGGNTVACPTTPVACNPGTKVVRTAPTAATISSGTTSTSLTDTCTIDGNTTPYVYQFTGVCTGTPPPASESLTSITATMPVCQCGIAPEMSNVKINGQAYSENITPGGSFSFLQGSAITFTGTVTDTDSDYTDITVTLYYQSGGSIQSVTATMASDDTFTVSIPGSAVSADFDINWGIALEDELGLEGTPIPSGLDPADLANEGAFIDKGTINVGTKCDFVRLPYPNQYPFRAGGQRLVIDFALNESANVTTRIYAADGTLIRQIDNSTLDPEDNDNVCYWEKGCSWDGTSYLGGNNFAGNGLYIVNINAICNGQNFSGQALSYTKGVVVMK